MRGSGLGKAGGLRSASSWGHYMKSMWPWKMRWQEQTVSSLAYRDPEALGAGEELWSISHELPRLPFDRSGIPQLMIICWTNSGYASQRRNYFGLRKGVLIYSTVYRGQQWGWTTGRQTNQLSGKVSGTQAFLRWPGDWVGILLLRQDGRQRHCLSPKLLSGYSLFSKVISGFNSGWCSREKKKNQINLGWKPIMFCRCNSNSNHVVINILTWGLNFPVS